ncbi:MAG: signal peptidase I [Pseudomonadota bacterium]
MFKKTKHETDADDTPPPTKPPKKTFRGGVYEIAKFVIQVLVLVVVFRTFLFQAFFIPSASMVPSLLVGDQLFVSKYSYGYSKYSFPMQPFDFAGRFFDTAPKRGEVAVFHNPKTGVVYIKRIVGLAGDRLQMRDGVLFINDAPVHRQAQAPYPSDLQDPQSRLIEHYVELLPGGVAHHVLQSQGDKGVLDNTPQYNVPAGHVFMMGDNRDNSQDSRILGDVGYVPIENLIGRAEIIFFSIEPDSSWIRFWELPFKIRYGRLFSIIR